MRDKADRIKHHAERLGLEAEYGSGGSPEPPGRLRSIAPTQGQCTCEAERPQRKGELLTHEPERRNPEILSQNLRFLRWHVEVESLDGEVEWLNLEVESLNLKV